MNAENPHEANCPREKTGLYEFLRSGIESARQWMQPAAFRIAAPHAHEGPPPLETNADGPPASIDKYSSMREQLTEAMKTLAAVATAVWRAKAKLDAESQAELPAELRNLPRHVQAAWDALAAGEVQVDDPTGQPYVPGMAVNVLTFQPLDGLGCEMIHKTIKPSVYFNDVLIQRADVIVGRPLTESDKSQTNDAALKREASGDADATEEKGSNADGQDND